MPNTLDKNQLVMNLKARKEKMDSVLVKIWDPHTEITKLLKEMQTLIVEAESSVDEDSLSRILISSKIISHNWELQIIQKMIIELDEIIEKDEEKRIYRNLTGTDIVSGVVNVFSKFSAEVSKVTSLDSAVKTAQSATQTLTKSIPQSPCSISEVTAMRDRFRKSYAALAVAENTMTFKAFDVIFREYEELLDKHRSYPPVAEYPKEKVSRKNGPKKRKKLVEIEEPVEVITDVIAELQQKHNLLSETIKINTQDIQELFKKKPRALSYLQQKDPLILLQSEYLLAFEEKVFPALQKLEKSILKTQLILQKRYENLTLPISVQEELAQTEQEYKKLHGPLSKHTLYQILIEQEKEFLKHCDVLPQLKKSSDLINRRMDEIANPSKLKPYKEPFKQLRMSYGTHLDEIKQLHDICFQNRTQAKAKELDMDPQVSSLSRECKELFEKRDMLEKNALSIMDELKQPGAYQKPGLELLEYRYQQRNNSIKQVVETLSTLKQQLQEKVQAHGEAVAKAEEVAQIAYSKAQKDKEELIQQKTVVLEQVISRLRHSVQQIEGTASLAPYVSIDKDRLNLLITEVKTSIAQFSSKQARDIEIQYAIKLTELKDFQRSVEQQPLRAREYIAARRRLINRLDLVCNLLKNPHFIGAQHEGLKRSQETIKQRMTTYDESYNELSGQIIVMLDTEIGNGALKSLENETKSFISTYENRKNHPVSVALTSLLAQIDREKDNFEEHSSGWNLLNDLKLELSNHNNRFLNSDINLLGVCTLSLGTLRDLVTPDRVQQLTNYADDATLVGNVFRYLTEAINNFITNVIDIFVEIEKPPYRAQFFASDEEKNIVQLASIIQKKLSEVATLYPEEQPASVPQ